MTDRRAQDNPGLGYSIGEQEREGAAVQRKGNPPPANQPRPPSLHGVQDYQMQLMLLEQQKKKGGAMARAIEGGWNEPALPEIPIQTASETRARMEPPIDDRASPLRLEQGQNEMSLPVQQDHGMRASNTLPNINQAANRCASVHNCSLCTSTTSPKRRTNADGNDRQMESSSFPSVQHPPPTLNRMLDPISAANLLFQQSVSLSLMIPRHSKLVLSSIEVFSKSPILYVK
ncbi:hypothetical protein K469DRAFT_751549 [Zopfia rhizophila CBS 207.26]|uniref:Uncharacterized protein n=1 Tax=Zopfia rhizophila CBS 207.26 TaxID=1314779 RepID=A0A6A6DV63_9PEZI|nr:hypothetical protein K469DRAFT_751549 [Zopfia rhizophila CBS 207.26]